MEIMLTIKDLKYDKRNARKHSSRNIEMIQKSLKEVGTGRSIVIDEGNNILAGNGTVESFTKNGKTKIKIIDSDGDTLIAVRRKGLTEEEKKKLSLFDNRTAEIADWDVDILKELEQEIDLSRMFTEKELGNIFGEENEKEMELKNVFQVVIDCQDESHQAVAYEDISKMGYKCRVLTL